MTIQNNILKVFIKGCIPGSPKWRYVFQLKKMYLTMTSQARSTVLNTNLAKFFALKDFISTSVLDDAINTLRLRQNGCHFAGNIFKWISWHENLWIFQIKFHWNMAPLVQIMAWHWTGGIFYWCIYASLSLNKLKMAGGIWRISARMTSMVHSVMINVWHTRNKLIVA